MKKCLIFWSVFLVVTIAICAIGIAYPPVFNFGTGVGIYYLVNEFYPLSPRKGNGSSRESGDWYWFSEYPNVRMENPNGTH